MESVIVILLLVGIINQMLVSICKIFLIHIKFDNDRFSSFGNYLSLKIRTDVRQTDRQTNGRDLFFRTVGVIKRLLTYFIKMSQHRKNQDGHEGTVLE